MLTHVILPPLYLRTSENLIFLPHIMLARLPQSLQCLSVSYLHVGDHQRLKQCSIYWKSLTDRPESMPKMGTITVTPQNINAVMKYRPSRIVYGENMLDLTVYDCDFKSVKRAVMQCCIGLNKLINLEYLTLYRGKTGDLRSLTRLTTISMSPRVQIDHLPSTVTEFICNMPPSDVATLMAKHNISLKKFNSQHLYKDYSMLPIEELSVMHTIPYQYIKFPPTLSILNIWATELSWMESMPFDNIRTINLDLVIPVHHYEFVANVNKLFHQCQIYNISRLMKPVTNTSSKANSQIGPSSIILCFVLHSWEIYMIS